MVFSNPVVGGTTLLRNAIRSPDYVQGISGWSINKDGTAEFNDVTMRGSLDVEGTVVLDANDAVIVEDGVGHPVITLSNNPTGGEHNGKHYEPGVWHGWWEDPLTLDSVLQGWTQIMNTFLTMDVDTDLNSVEFNGLEDRPFIRLLHDNPTVGITTFSLYGGSNYAGSDPIAFIDLHSRSENGLIAPRVVIHGAVEMENGASVATDLSVGDDLTVTDDVTVGGDAVVSGSLSAANEVFGSVSVAAGGSAVVSQSVTFPALAGTGAVHAVVTANSASANLRTCTVSAVSSTGITVNVFRDGAITNTTCYYHVRRAP